MVWLLIFILVIVLQGPIQNGFGAGAVLGTIVLFLVATGVWLWTQLLLANRVSWLVLLPGALLAAAATSALSSPPASTCRARSTGRWASTAPSASSSSCCPG
ncbi:hypothetical protein ACH419_13625 [Streptomyces bobili]|uniref:hypothetical protein n=1 Tax=Streptomyces TaxID=1883 RepID=UPI0016786C07|nr:hypothetical protein [Streptomyces galilaeus]